MRRDDEIELSSDEDGFKGSWYRATLLDTPAKSGSKKFNVSLLVSYRSFLIKPTYRRFIRPIPPEDLFSAVDFEEGSVVEVSHRGGWWTGVVVKKINHDNLWVYFDSPPDIIQFKTTQLRQHFDWVWTKEEWVRPPNEVLRKKSTFGCGTMVEVKTKEKTDDDVWVPSVIVKEMERGKNFIVKPCKYLKNFIVKPSKYLNWNDGEEPKPNRTVSSLCIRLTPPRLSVENYELMDSVEAFLDPGWRPGMVKSILAGNQYTVCLTATNESLVFNHFALRPSQESLSKPFLQNTTDVNAGITPQRPLSPGENIEMPEEHNSEDDSRKRKRGEVEHNPDLSETLNDSVSPLTPPTARTATALKQTEASTQEKTVQPESSEENNNRERKRAHNLSSTAGVEETQAKDTVVVLPFAKKSQLWKPLETMEVFQKEPQSPHFSPLVEESEEFREGLAFGMMLTLSKLLEQFKELEPDVSMSRLDSLKVSFTKLVKHGFNVSAPLARINKLLDLKGRHLKTMEEQKGFNIQIGEMEHKILELVRQQEALKEQTDAAFQNKRQIESCARARDIELDNLESEMKATLFAPW